MGPGTPRETIRGNATEPNVESDTITLSIQMALEAGTLQPAENSNSIAEQAPEASPANASTDVVDESTVSSVFGTFSQSGHYDGLAGGVISAGGESSTAVTSTNTRLPPKIQPSARNGPIACIMSSYHLD